MPAPEAASFPFEALAEGVAAVAGDGALTAQNAAMRALLAACGDGSTGCRSLRELPLAEPQRRELEAGATVTMAAAGREHELSLHGSGARRWLCAREVEGPADGGDASTLAAARVRQLGRLAATIAHELNNLLGSAMGLASLLAPTMTEAADRRLLDEMQRGAQRGATLARGLARQLKVGPRQRVAAPVGTLIDEATAICGRAATMRQVELLVHVAAALPPIRVVVVEAVQALLHGIIALLDAAPQRVVVAAEPLRCAIGGGRQRDCVRVRVQADGCRQPVGNGDATPADWQAMAQLAMRTVGGELATSSNADSHVLDYVWPALAAG
jgi:signal transduction histidine kinase